jgi:MSHA biogenesis protein MshI
MLSFFSKAKKPGWLVAQLDAGTARLAHVVPANGKALVAFCEERPYDPAEPRTLEKIRKEFQVESYRCTALMNTRQYQIVQVEAPNVKADELRAAMRWRIKDLIDFHVDDAIIDVLDIPPAPAPAARGHFMYAIVARSEHVRAMIDLYEHARFPLGTIDIPEMAQRNLAARIETEGRGIALLSFNEDGGLITFTAGGELYMSRRIDVPASSMVDADDATRSAAQDRAALELQRSLDHFERQFSYVTLDRVIVAPLPRPTDLVERIAANTDLPVQPLDIEAVVQPAAEAGLRSAEQVSRWLMLLGAGLRVEPRSL